MDPVEWYSVILGAIVGVALLIFVIVTLAECVKGPLFRSKTRRQVGALAIWIGPDVLLFLLFLAANIVPIVYDIKDADTFIRNSARITIAGLVPLSLGGHISPIPNAIRFRFDTFAKCHRWLGRLTIIEGIVHVTAAWWLHPPDTRTPSIIAGFIVGQPVACRNITKIAQALAIFAVTLLALPIRWMWEFLLGSCFRVSFSEIFLASHQWFCVAAMVAIYAHAPSHSFTKSSSIFLLCAGAVQITVLLTRLDNLVRRNVKAGKFLHVAKLKDMQLRKKPVQDSVEIHIPLRRGWTLEAGQYVYFRGHPFYISQWYTEKDHEFIEKDDEFIGKAKDFIVLVVEKKGGFTSRLYDKCGWTKALLEGPYGKRLDLWNVGNGAVNQASDKYSDVIFFATGIGLVGQLPYINEILASSKSTRVRVFWEIDRTGRSGRYAKE